MAYEILPETRVSILSADHTGESQPIEIDQIKLPGTLSVAQAIAEVDALGYSVMTDTQGGCCEIDQQGPEWQTIVVTVWPQQAPANDPITLESLQSLVSDGKIFSVEFIKKSTGQLRRMTCRTGVRRHLKGGRSYDFQSRGLLPVWDLHSKDYRCVPVANIKRLTVAGKTHLFR